MVTQNRVWGKDYPVVKKISDNIRDSFGTGKRPTVRFVNKFWPNCSKDTVWVEMTPSWVYDQWVVFEFPVKGKFDIVPGPNCGHRYVRYSYEQVEKELEYPSGSVAARSVASNAAALLWPDTPNNKKKQQESDKKRAEYVEKNWREIHNSMLLNMVDWANRQRYNLTDRHFRIYENDPFLDKLKLQMMPQANLWEEFLE